MTAFFVFNAKHKKSITVSYSDYVLAAFQRQGAMIVEEKAFLDARHAQSPLPSGDRVVNFYCENVGAVWARCPPQFRWNYSIDEVSTEDGRAYGTKLNQCAAWDCKRIIVTYVNPRHLKNLEDAGISHVGMPCCPPRVRPRTIKPHAIASFGTFHPKTYPERTRIRDILVDVWGSRYVHQYLDVPVSGEAFGDVLDDYQLGIVCRAGYRDRFVQKYVEYGASHVLPVGDCPSYMPLDMKQVMVNTEGKSREWIINEVSRLLTRDGQELTQRQELFSQMVAQRYNILQHTKRVLSVVQNF